MTETSSPAAAPSTTAASSNAPAGPLYADRMLVTRRVSCVGAVIHDDEHRLLVIRRAHAPSAGRWSIPGGRIEAGESDAEALRREVLEETGLVVTVGMWVGTVEIPGAGGATYDIRDYACAAVSGTLAAGDDALEARWVTRAELLQLDTVRDLVATLERWGVLPA
jgi:8-oxo-dGTP diphosphatase